MKREQTVQMNYQIVGGLDAGSGETRCVICALDNGALRFLGHGAAQSRGWVKGRVGDQEALAESIRLAVREAEHNAQASLEHVVVGMGGPSIAGLDNRGLYEFGRPRRVEPGDMSYAIEQATRVRLEEDRMLLQVFPQDFTVDGRAGFRNPRGFECARLEANVHLLTVSQYDHQAVVSAVHMAHLAVDETVYEPMAAAYASVLPEERARGVALVDIGLHTTDIVIYDGDSLLRAGGVPIAGDHLTRDVAWGLCVAYDDAEQLKREYGCAVLGLASDTTLIEVPSHEGRPGREATAEQLNEILEARAEELFTYVAQVVGKARMEQTLGEGVVLTGGAARLNGMCDMAERVLKCQARNGLVVGIGGWPDGLLTTEWTTAAGLAMYAGRLKVRSVKPRGGFWGFFNGNGKA